MKERQGVQILVFDVKRKDVIDMGFIKHIYLYCDGQTFACECPNMEASECDGNYETIKEYRDAMIKAYCPSCRLVHLATLEMN